MPSTAQSAGRITLPPDSATNDELWQWIENVLPRIEEFNQAADEAGGIAETLRLTGIETALFRALYAAHGRMVTNETLWNAAWGDEERVSSNLKVTIYKLRKKLRHSPYCIDTRWGQGYVLTPANQEQEQENEREQAPR